MIDLSKIAYRLTVMDSGGKQYNIKEFVTGLGWEENKNEISVRTSFTAKNDKTSAGRLSELIKPGCLIGIFASDGGKQDREVARGTVQEWNPQEQSSSNTLKCVAYDSLYDLQRSQDNKFYSAGTGTKSIMTGAFDEWGIPTKGYSGPNVSHEKMKYSSSYVSDMLLDVLDDAYKKGGGKFIIRAAEGYADVVERGTNTDVYVFRVDNTKSISQSISTASLVTRVKVLGQADDDGNYRNRAGFQPRNNNSVRNLS